LPSTLTSLRDRVESALMDSSNLSWDTGTLDEAIRQALAFVIKARAPASPYTLSGLDGASSTTLPEADTAYLVMGAAGFAARSRAVNRTQAANLAEAMPAALLSWSSAQLDAFFFGLGLKSSASTTTGSSDALDIATLETHSAETIAAGHNTSAQAVAAAQAANAITLLQMQIDAAVAAVALANQRADALKSAEASRITGLQGSHAKPHAPLAWDEPKRW
jgi:hypothetical protein